MVVNKNKEQVLVKIVSAHYKRTKFKDPAQQISLIQNMFKPPADLGESDQESTNNNNNQTQKTT